MATGKKLNVLFVEDSEDDMELLLNELHREYLGVTHHRVDSAVALRAALAMAKWDVIICDHNMPTMDAPLALRMAQENHADTPFIIVSGHINPDIAATTMLAGAADTISKADLTRLIPAIERELKKKSAMQELALAWAEVDHIAYYDQLTGLHNREYLAKKTAEYLASPLSREGMAMLVINLNRFLQIQRSMGVRTSNLVLQIVAQRIKECVGDTGIPARLGGDRFALLMFCVKDADAVKSRIGEIREQVEEVIKVDEQEYYLSSTVGVCLHVRDGGDFNDLLGNAETAMYQARANGSCGYLFFDPAMSAAGQEQVILESALHRAIRHNEFFLHYQPQYDLLSGKMTGVEALLRWQLPDGGVVSPAKFIPLLEETELIIPVGEWVMQTACEQNRVWQEMGLSPVRMAVNLSAIQFRRSDIVQMVRRILEQTRLDPCYLELEITENVVIRHEEATIATLSELHGMGISLAIDDFGTGYSSLSYLRRFPVQKLKIDRSFVMDISEQESGDSLVKGIASLAHNLGLSVIAEGVETEAQAAFLRGCGCEEVQGYLYGRPAPNEVIEDVLRA